MDFANQRPGPALLLTIVVSLRQTSYLASMQIFSSGRSTLRSGTPLFQWFLLASLLLTLIVRLDLMLAQTSSYGSAMMLDQAQERTADLPVLRQTTSIVDLYCAADADGRRVVPIAPSLSWALVPCPAGLQLLPSSLVRSYEVTTAS